MGARWCRLRILLAQAGREGRRRGEAGGGGFSTLLANTGILAIGLPPQSRSLARLDMSPAMTRGSRIRPSTQSG